MPLVRRLARSAATAAVVTLLGAPTLVAQTGDQTPRRIADGVYLLSTADGGNAGWADLGPDLLAIVGSPTPATIAMIERLGGKPVRAAFAPNGSPRAGFGARELTPSSRGATTGLSFRGTMTLGARRAEVRELERAVSAGNGIVYLPDAGVLFAGDLVGDGVTLDSTRTEVWIRVLERLRRLGPTVVVPSRGAAGGPELLERTHSALVAARAAARAGIDRRATIDEIAGSAPTPELTRHAFREMVGLVPPAMIEELELRPGPSFTRATPGWTKPKVVVIEGMWFEKPGRVAELAYLAPGVDIRMARSPAESATMIADADGFLGRLSGPQYQRATRLRWVQTPSAGVEGQMAIPGFAASPVVLTNAQRIYAPPLVEHVFGLLLGLTRRVQVAVPLMRERRWDPDQFEPLEMPEMRGKTLLVAGLGGIGTEVAALGRAMGMRVIATRNNKTPPTDIVEYVGASSELATLAREADVIVNALPLTPATDQVFSAAVFRVMKPTAYFINIGRGGTVDTEALTEALATKRLAGAGLDVTRPEPLPASHRLWTLPNVILTPHVGSNSDSDRERTWLLFRENLRRYVAGEPLLSVVDKQAAY
ncbi:MAG: NAD(P)-dependent oxidoreductase [Gemmatimonadales bacterium]